MKSLPISMEDKELFSGERLSMADFPKLNEKIFDEMYSNLNKLWWSRLVIATRGYVVNDFQDNEDTIFCFDDAFIHLHKSLVEGSRKDALTVFRDIELLRSESPDSLRDLADGYQLSEEKHPFYLPKSRDAFARLFGPPGFAIYQRAYKQGFAYLVFQRTFCKLQQRWLENSQKKKGVIFEEDPEWQPDDRVVIFHRFFEGNRTWILMDFDRHVMAVWKPKGANIIFGDRYLQVKRDEGYQLCTQCGMLESQPGEFLRSENSKFENKKSSAVLFCTKECQQMYCAEQHKIERNVTRLAVH